MWDFIKFFTIIIFIEISEEFLSKGSTDQASFSVEELKLKQVAETEAKKSAHREKLQKMEVLINTVQIESWLLYSLFWLHIKFLHIIYNQEEHTQNMQ